MIKNCLAVSRPDILSKWHPSLNGQLTPFDVSVWSHKKVWWKCDKEKDHEWEASVARIAGGENCSCCAGKKVVKSNCLATTHPSIAQEWHPILNGQLTAGDVVCGSRKKVWWKCDKEKDHEWEATLNSRKYSGCPFCSGSKVCKSNCLFTTHPEIAKEFHPFKNGNLNVFNISFGCNKRVWWKCTLDTSHEWEASVANRTCHDSNCPHCKDSKGERKISNYLNCKNVNYKKQFIFSNSEIKNSRFDFKVNNENFNGVIEYHGSQHYIPKSFGVNKSNKTKEIALENNVRRDYKKEKWCLENNIKMLIIPYWDFDNIEIILNDLLVGNVPVISDPPSEIKKYQNFIEKIRANI